MEKYITEGYNTYIINDLDGTITNADSHITVTRVWAYPVRQAVWGSDHAETLYFATAGDRSAYMADHDHCDRLPRCKVMSDRITPAAHA